MSEIKKALAAAIAECRAVEKDGRNSQQGYDFASAESIINECRGPMSRNGLSIAYTVLETVELEPVKTRSGSELRRQLLKLGITVMHQSGEELPQQVYVAECMDSGDKGLLKGLTICQREHLRQLMMIPRGAFDPEADPSVDEPNEAKPKAEKQRETKPKTEKPKAEKSAKEVLEEHAELLFKVVVDNGGTETPDDCLHALGNAARELAGPKPAAITVEHVKKAYAGLVEAILLAKVGGE